MKKTFRFVMSAAALAPALALADETSTVAERARTFAEVWQNGGILMYVLAALSILGLAGIIYFLATIRRGTVAPPLQAAKLRELLKSGRRADARSLCAAQPTALGSVAAAALDFLKDNPKATPAMVKEIIESEGARQTSRLQSMIHYLLDLSSVAPMVGLLGTVLGLLRAFHTVAFDPAQAKPQALATGVGQALVTTIAGLVVAIPALIAYSWFRGRVAKLTSSLERSSSELYAVMESESSSTEAP